MNLGKKHLIAIIGISLGLASIEIGSSGWIAIIPILAGILGFLFWGRFEESMIKMEISRELTKAAREFQVSLESGMSFLEAIQRLANKETILGREFKKILEKINRGTPIPLALQESSETLGRISKDYSKFINTLVIIYRSGGGGNMLERLAENLESQRLTRMREYSSKSIMYSLLLIAVSAVLPALFLTYLIVGSLFLKVPVNPVDAFLFPTMVIPIMDITLLMFIWAKQGD